MSAWWAGPTNAIDRLMFAGVDAIEISYQLDLPLWLVRGRFAHRAAQFQNMQVAA